MPRESANRAGTPVPQILIEGFAWIDSDNYQIARM